MSQQYFIVHCVVSDCRGKRDLTKELERCVSHSQHIGKAEQSLQRSYRDALVQRVDKQRGTEAWGSLKRSQREYRQRDDCARHYVLRAFGLFMDVQRGRKKKIGHSSKLGIQTGKGHYWKTKSRWRKRSCNLLASYYFCCLTSWKTLYFCSL